MYTDIGISEFQNLANMFTNAELASTLDSDQTWNCYTYEFHSEEQPGFVCNMQAGIHYDSKQRVFKKFIHSLGLTAIK